MRTFGTIVFIVGLIFLLFVSILAGVIIMALGAIVIGIGIRIEQNDKKL